MYKSRSRFVDSTSATLAVLVLSCDKYSSLWPLFFQRFHKYWASCPYPVYLLSNKMKFSDNGVIAIGIGDDKDWSSNLLRALSKVREENVLLLMEDAPLNSCVEQKKLDVLYQRFIVERMNYLRLKAEPKPMSSTDGVGELPPGALYRTALVPSIWEKEMLAELLVPGESAWQFEIRGSDRSDRLDGFFSVDQNLFQFVHCIVQGKLDRRAFHQLKKGGEDPSCLKFPVMTYGSYYFMRIKEVRSFFMNLLVPYRYRRRVRSAYYRLFADKSPLA